jgi:hypothetical protein
VTPTCTSLSAGPAHSDPSLSGGGAHCEKTANPNNFQQSFYTNFNTSAFTLAPIGTFGIIGENTLRQPSWSNWNVANTQTGQYTATYSLRQIATTLRFEFWPIIGGYALPQ